MGDIKPFGNRIAVIDPPAQEEKYNGLIIPSHIAMEKLAVGIIVNTEADELDEAMEIFRQMGLTAVKVGLKIGTLVYYIEGAGWPIRDVRIINIMDVVAYEELD